MVAAAGTRAGAASVLTHIQPLRDSAMAFSRFLGVRSLRPPYSGAMAAPVAKGGLSAIAALEEQWQEVHEASLATLRQVVSRSQGSALEPPFLATLPSQALSGLRQAEAHAREELGATTALLLEQVATHEVLLEAMYDVHLAAMHDASRLSPQQASDRGTHRLGTSPADRCAALATALRAYEAELQLKQASVHAVRAGAPTLELQALLLSWEVRLRGEAELGVPSCPEPPSALPVSPSGCPDAHLPPLAPGLTPGRLKSRRPHHRWPSRSNPCWSRSRRCGRLSTPTRRWLLV